MRVGRREKDEDMRSSILSTRQMSHKAMLERSRWTNLGQDFLNPDDASPHLHLGPPHQPALLDVPYFHAIGLGHDK